MAAVGRPFKMQLLEPSGNDFLRFEATNIEAGTDIAGGAALCREMAVPRVSRAVIGRGLAIASMILNCGE
jgi:hypothetical protein